MHGLIVLYALSDQVTIVAQTVVILVVVVGAIWTIKSQRTNEWRAQAEAFRDENRLLGDKVTTLQAEMSKMPKLDTVDARILALTAILEGHIRNVTISHERTREQHELLMKAADHQRVEHKQLSEEHQDMIEQMAKLNTIAVAVIAKLGEPDVQAHTRRRMT